MSEANADKTSSPDPSAKSASSPPASSTDELVKDLEVQLSDEEQSRVAGGWKWIKSIED